MGIVPNPNTDLTSEQDFTDALSGHFVRDPLSEVTRKERRILLGVSAVGVIMVKANILPQKISALGIDFGEINKGVLLKGIALITSYFLLAFFLYSISDFLAWRIAIQQYLFERPIEASDESFEDFAARRAKMNIYRLRDQEAYRFRLQRLGFVAKPVSFLRAIFEFLFPIVFSIYAVVILFKAPA